MTKILVGSRAFFNGMKGFQSKDRDYLVLVEQSQGFNWRREQSVRGICTFVKDSTAKWTTGTEGIPSGWEVVDAK